MGRKKYDERVGEIKKYEGVESKGSMRGESKLGHLDTLWYSDANTITKKVMMITKNYQQL